MKMTYEVGPETTGLVIAAFRGRFFTLYPRSRFYKNAPKWGYRHWQGERELHLGLIGMSWGNVRNPNFRQ